MINFIKKITGIAKIEEATALAEQAKADSLAKAAEAKLQEEAAKEAQRLAKEAEDEAKLTPKDRATRKKEPWVAVLDTHVNKDNIRNGFFELDWNEYFIVQLKQAGYGADGDAAEEIVDRWFRDIVYNMFAESGVDTARGSGYINVVPISKGKSEVS